MIAITLSRSQSHSPSDHCQGESEIAVTDCADAEKHGCGHARTMGVPLSPSARARIPRRRRPPSL